jgi:3-oxoacyl-[acyl-carrier protein] reductase
MISVAHDSTPSDSVDLGLAGRPALVAAATRGLGYASALALAREGARVALCARDGDEAAAAAARIAAETGVEVTGFGADVGTAEGATGFVREAAEALGGCQVLVANAGGPPPGRAGDMGDEDHLAALQLTYLSTVRMVREALPHMREAGFGRVVAIGSSSVREPIPGIALSNAARGAAAGFLKTLAREVAGEGITVNMVLPGRILTARTRQLLRGRGSDEQEALREYASEVPAGRLGDPQELGDVVAFLCSERASYVTGAFVPIDGGLLRSLG